MELRVGVAREAEGRGVMRIGFVRKYSTSRFE